MDMVWDWKSITSLLATAVFVRSVARDFLPPELIDFFTSLLARILAAVCPTSTLIIDEFDSSSGFDNEIFDAAHCYLSSRCLASASILRLSKTKGSNSLSSALPSAHSATDLFDGAEMRWRYYSVDRPSSSRLQPRTEHRYFELSFHRKHKDLVRPRYVQHVLDEAARLKLKARDRRLFTNRPGSSSDDYHGHQYWSSVAFHHPSTFDTLAIDPDLRDSIRNDLLRFSARRDYYARVGRAWKRGYLLHGPPGTGKTSLIAAIANFLEFDIYDLELTAVSNNTHLRKLLVSTSPKSVVVIEDVDCSLDLSDRKSKLKKLGCEEEEEELDSPTGGSQGSSLSLSGVLNFMDGLWSSCVGERLMIFTTNHPERLDPALLRPGRMDKKIHLSYCEASAFRFLAKNYLEVKEGHEMMEEAVALLDRVKVTPADIAEIFMGCDGYGADVGMRRAVQELRDREKMVLLEQQDGVGNGGGTIRF